MKKSGFLPKNYISFSKFKRFYFAQNKRLFQQIDFLKHKLLMKHIKYIFFVFFLILFITPIQAQIPKVLKHPSSIKVQRVNILNSSNRETNMNISPDGKYLFFMSGRGLQPWSNPTYTRYKGKWEADGDIWYSKKVGGAWQYPKCVSKPVNTSSGEDEPNISPDGQRVVFQSWSSGWERKGGPYYQSSLNGTVWGYPKGLGGGINAFFKDRQRKGLELATDGVTVSADEKTFIVAVGPYDGNMDLYISRKNAYGYWGYPKKLSVSTFGNERAPFLAGDGKTLYFASDGYGGWGGLDIYKTTINENGTHGPIINVGIPFNSYLDDYGLILTASGDEAYFVREGDIYFADTKEANPEIKPSSATLMITGVVTSSTTKKPIGAIIKITDAKTGALITQINSNSFTGEYSAVIPIKNKNFKQEVTKVGFTKKEQAFDQDIHEGLNQIISNVELVPIGVKPPKKVQEEAAAEMVY